MTGDIPERDSIFCAAIEIASAAERAAHIARACGDNAALRREVEQLVAAHFQAGAFLDQPVVGDATAAHRPESDAESGDRPPGADATGLAGPGTRIGPYKLLEQIGEGGMGTVWMAEQTEPVRRRVALKIIKPGMDSRHVLARFEAEWQALALMDHPNIAKVLDAGTVASCQLPVVSKDKSDGPSLTTDNLQLTTVGRPYFVMELVKGVPITSYCDHHRLTPRERLELFVPVCQAIQHAHQKGIIHRDVKPSNVLVAPYDGKPVIKVIDFGVAKAIGQQLTEKTLFTGFGAVVGTLEYMSPEQAELNNQDIDTRSDVYSLGVLLYELLTGTTPLSRKRLKEAAFTELLRIIREEEPPKPSLRLSESKDTLPTISAQRQTEPARLAKLVKGELDWIVMKALEKDRNRRYESANSLALDVGRYLADEPVEACAPTPWYRLRKMARKHRKALAVAGLFALLLVAAAIVSTWEAALAKRAEADAKADRDAAEAARDAEAAQREAAQRAQQQLRNVLDEQSSEVIDDWLARQDTLSPEQRKFLEKTLAHYEDFSRETGDTAEQRAALARAHGRVGEIRQRLGLNDKAVEAYKRAITLLKALSAEFPETPAYRTELAAGHNHMNLVLEKLGQLAEAEAECREAVAMYERLAQDFPTEPAYRLDLARDRNNLGNLLRRKGRWTDSRREYTDARDSLKQLVRDFPQTPQFPRQLAMTYANLGILANESGRPAEALDPYQEVLDIYKRLVDAFPRVADFRRELAMSQSNLGVLYQQLGRHGQAEAAYRESLKLRKQLVHDFPSVPDYRRDLAGSHINLGIVLRTLGRLEESETEYRTALRHQQQLMDDFPSVPDYRYELAVCHDNLGMLIGRQPNRKPEAAKEHGEAVKLLKQLVHDGPTSPSYRWELVKAGGNLGMALRALGRPEEAEPEYREALKIGQELVRENPTIPAYRQELAFTCSRLGNVLWDKGSRDEGEDNHREAQALRQQLVKDFPGNPEFQQDLANSHRQIGQLHVMRGRKTDAETAFRAALDLQKKLVSRFPTVPEYQQDLSGTYETLGSFYQEQHRPEDAVTPFQEALKVRDKLVRDFPTSPQYRQELGDRHNRLGVYFRNKDRWRDAELQYREAVRIEEQLVHEFPTTSGYAVELAGSYCNFGNLESSRAQPKAALDWYAKAMTTLQPLVEKQPAPVKARRFLRNCFVGRAEAFDALKRPDEARKDWDKALKLDDEKLAQIHVKRALSLALVGKSAEAVAAYQQAEQPKPTDAATYDRLAWLLAMWPYPTYRNPTRAVEFANKAVELAPREPTARNTLALTRYRTGEWKPAIEEAEKATAMGTDPTPVGCLVLAMAHWQQGNKDEARRWYDKTTPWPKKNPAKNPELDDLRAEAANLLGVKKE